MSTIPVDTFGEKIEYLFKVLVVGDIGTGKTSLIRRYVHGTFSQQYKATIGVDFGLKNLQYLPGVIAKLSFWDVAGQERFGNMTRVYYKAASGAFVVFDVTRPRTFEAAIRWKQDLDDKSSDGPIPIFLLANKVDLCTDNAITKNIDQMNQFCADNGFCGWFETSAKENFNLANATHSLVEKMIRRLPESPIERDEDIIDRLHSDNPALSIFKPWCLC